jgi:hypothetical protein
MQLQDSTDVQLTIQFAAKRHLRNDKAPANIGIAAAAFFTN